MDLQSLLTNAVLAIVILSLPSVAWFFWMRRVLIRRQAHMIRKLEEKLRPRDKQYWVIGYLVGFAARYKTGDPRTPVVWVTYTTPPYHVFFYLPVIILGRKKERLEIAVEPSTPRLLPGTAYVYKPLIGTIALRTRKVKARLGGKAKQGSLSLNGSSYKTLYDNPGALRIAEKIAREWKGGGEIQMTFVDAHDKALGLSLGLDPKQSVPTLVGEFLDMARRL